MIICAIIFTTQGFAFLWKATKGKTKENLICAIGLFVGATGICFNFAALTLNGYKMPVSQAVLAREGYGKGLKGSPTEVARQYFAKVNTTKNHIISDSKTKAFALIDRFRGPLGSSIKSIGDIFIGWGFFLISIALFLKSRPITGMTFLLTAITILIL